MAALNCTSKKKKKDNKISLWAESNKCLPKVTRSLKFTGNYLFQVGQGISYHPVSQQME